MGSFPEQWLVIEPKFEGDILETSKYIGPQLCEILQTLVGWGVGGKFVHPPPPSPHINVCKMGTGNHNVTGEAGNRALD